MMPRNRKLGQCLLCQRDLSKSGASRHIKLCRRQNPPTPAGGSQSLHIAVTDSFGGGAYWLQLEAPADAPLSALDKFLRAVWLDCCGHLSAFYIRNSEYISHLPEDDADSLTSNEMGFARQAMDSISIGQAAERGKFVANTRSNSFEYMYDFGSPTKLALRIYEDRWDDGNGEIRLLARNYAPDTHGNAAATRHSQSAGGLAADSGIREDCAANQPGGEGGALLPIVNSPRSGACGYAGAEPDSQA